ncbi:predicted protein [Postia placenta Mad-698-R]|nr:predicted protein [Postia placenta Mad-698-R]
MYAAIDESNTLVGFAMWMPPGRVPLTTEEERQLGWNQFWKKLSPEGREYCENVLAKDFSKFLEESFGFSDVQESTYWCSFAMIREDYQNKGVATAIFDLVYAKAKETGAIMALGTSLEMTSKIYQSMGFEQKGFRVTPSPWKDWTNYVLMRRTAT